MSAEDRPGPPAGAPSPCFDVVGVGAAVVDRTFPLSEARAAHEHMEKSQMFGKIVLKP